MNLMASCFQLRRRSSTNITREINGGKRILAVDLAVSCDSSRNSDESDWFFVMACRDFPYVVACIELLPGTPHNLDIMSSSGVGSSGRDHQDGLRKDADGFEAPRKAHDG